MLRMLRFRRYRVFLIFAGVVSLLLFRLKDTKNWNQYSHSHGESAASQTNHLEVSKADSAGAKQPADGQIKPNSMNAAGGSSPERSSTTAIPTVVQSVPHIVLPDRKVPNSPMIEEDEEEKEDDIHPVHPPGRQELPVFSAVPTTIRWEKQVEHFPVPTESIIQLPTGVPAAIPKIQHSFNDETPDAKINREARQFKVKEEFKKAWTGYKQKAWLHDELSPVSGNYRDPFCGWAATLVDSLDTLWIMGLRDEFEEAARAVDLIDFTTTKKDEIPVFETTIRYLGGLLAAYDVSGGKYQNLLDKAVELANVLMGAFDTPNRMPVLHYRWRPAFASQPHRASTSTSLAELGSLSLEFTRLAQLTKDPRYYDAVARITNALSEWQDRGTKLGGVFPESVDASGCNGSIPRSSHELHPNGPGNPQSVAEAAKEPEGYQPSMPATVSEPKPKKKKIKGDENSLEVQIVPGEPSKAEILGWGDDGKGKKMSSKRGLDDTIAPNRTESPVSKDPITGLPTDMSGAKTQIGNSLGDWDCVPQGLDSSGMKLEKFSMGGGQDSTYEYFPKQYLLLAGRDDKYRQMYLKTIDAVRKWMLYRPMLPGDRDVLFSGAVTTQGNPEKDLLLTPEVEHLTCFIGGMVGMGAKIFGLEADLEIAQKLADGCVWAYESTASKIMPESSTVFPCESAEYCTWNETAYWEYLDPAGETRDRNLERYIAKAAYDAEQEAIQEAAAIEAEKERIAAKEAAAKLAEGNTVMNTRNNSSRESAPNLAPAQLQKRQQATNNFKEDVASATGQSGTDPGDLKRDSPPPSETISTDKTYLERAQTTEAELRGFASGRQAEAPLSEKATAPTRVRPGQLRPLSHKEWVEDFIKREALPPGFVTIDRRKYILRPEAIESVWYMYRITGDSSWQDKGWKMFEAIIKATSTEYGHSAIRDVTALEPDAMDEMESFWLAETLKYFFLLYSTPDTISLDEWVLNTEAHPLRRET